MQTDGNLVLYDGETALWASHTQWEGEPPFHVIMQDDGNLVLYDNLRNATWSSETRGKNPHVVLQNDGKLVIYDGNRDALWSNGTKSLDNARMLHCAHYLNGNLKGLDCKGGRKAEVVCQKGK